MPWFRRDGKKGSPGKGPDEENAELEKIAGEARETISQETLFERFGITPGTIVECEHPLINKGKKNNWEVTDIRFIKSSGAVANMKQVGSDTTGWFSITLLLTGHVRIAGTEPLTNFWRNPSPAEAEKVFALLGWHHNNRIATAALPKHIAQIIGFGVYSKQDNERQGGNYTSLVGDPAALLKAPSKPDTTADMTPLTGLLAVGYKKIK